MSLRYYRKQYIKLNNYNLLQIKYEIKLWLKKSIKFNFNLNKLQRLKNIVLRNKNNNLTKKKTLCLLTGRNKGVTQFNLSRQSTNKIAKNVTIQNFRAN